MSRRCERERKHNSRGADRQGKEASALVFGAGPRKESYDNEHACGAPEESGVRQPADSDKLGSDLTQTNPKRVVVDPRSPST